MPRSPRAQMAETTLYLEPAVKEALQAEAEAEERSLSYLVRRILRQHVHQQQKPDDHRDHE